MRFFGLSLLLLLGLWGHSATAQELSVIRDTETESALRAWADPVFKAAGLSQKQVNIVLVGNPSVNAFVAGGANIFIYTGLIEKADFAEEVIGVMAHETGHITGGHLIASRRAMERASYQSILSSILGVGAAIATGNGSAASAISLGGTGMAQRGFFSHSRAQESAADQAALDYFDRAGLSPQGLVTFMQKLEGEELLPASQQSEYMRTHPLTRDRLSAMQHGLNQSSYAGAETPIAIKRQFDRIKAKLVAFNTPHNVPRFYPDPSAGEASQYAHAIMNYRQRRYDKAIAGFDALIAHYPNDPYYYEMKAQTYRDSGDLPMAEKMYSKALSLMGGDAPLVQIALAHVMVERDTDPQKAKELLLKALQKEKRDTRPYRLLATIEGRQNNEAAARYYLAEEAAAQGRRAESERLLQLATRDNALDGALALKARDLKTYLDGLPKGDD